MKIKMKVCFLIIVLSFIAAGALHSSSYIRANDEKSGYVFGVRERDGPRTEIVGDLSGVKSNVTITSIIGPKGEELQADDLVYDVDANGVYKFDITYKTEDGEYHEESSVNVDTILNVQQEDKSEDVSISSLPSVSPKSMPRSEFDQLKIMQSKAISEMISVDAYQAASKTPFQTNLMFAGGDINAQTAPQAMDGVHAYRIAYWIIFVCAAFVILILCKVVQHDDSYDMQ